MNMLQQLWNRKSPMMGEPKKRNHGLEEKFKKIVQTNLVLLFKINQSLEIGKKRSSPQTRKFNENVWMYLNVIKWTTSPHSSMVFMHYSIAKKQSNNKNQTVCVFLLCNNKNHISKSFTNIRMILSIVALVGWLWNIVLFIRCIVMWNVLSDLWIWNVHRVFRG